MLVMSIVMVCSRQLIELLVKMFPLRCPGLCSCGCWSCFQGEKSDLESTKILTVRFSSINCNYALLQEMLFFCCDV